MLKVKTLNVISLQDWDELVSSTYGRPYSLQQQNGCMERQMYPITVPVDKIEAEKADKYSNDDIDAVWKINGPKMMGIKFSIWKEKEVSEKISWEENLIWSRNFYPPIEMVINDLYERGLIEAGDYVIEIDW